MPIESIISRLDMVQLLAGTALSIILAFLSVRFRALSRSGGLGVVIIGAVVFGLGGMTFAIPMIFFFVASSLLTFMTSPAKRVAMIAFDKTGPRDIRQVLANGGVGAICVIIYFVTGKFVWLFPYLASLCAAAADTWATELGTLSKQYPVSIITFKKIEPGRSGGVTIPGLLAAAAGSLMVTLSGYAAVIITQGAVAAGMWLAAFNAGFAGSILDSILGGSIQAMYRCPLCNRITERKTHCGDSTRTISGLWFVDNDMVNFISVLFAAAAVALMFLI